MPQHAATLRQDAAAAETAAPPPAASARPVAAVSVVHGIAAPSRAPAQPKTAATGTSPAPAPAPSPKPDCNPSYTLDADGNKHFKPECFR